jgi:hypothetical protein
MRRLLGPLALLGLPFVAPDARPADQPAGNERPAIEIEALVARLGDKDFRARQAAGRALEERGEAALPALRRAAGAGDEEVRRRAEVLARKIERAALLSPRHVTLALKDRPVDEVVKELARQSGYRLQYQGGQPRRVTLELENVTYWQALEKICNDAGLTPGFDDQQGLTYLYQQDTISPYSYHTGPFRFVATNFNYNRYVNLANLPRNGQDPNAGNDNNLNFGFMIQAEPKVPLLAVSPPRLSKAEDENGISLLPRGLDGAQFQVNYYEGNGLYRNFQHTTSAQMAKPAKEATKAKLIKGRVMVTLLSGTKPDVVVEKLAIGKKKLTAAGRTVDVEIEEVAEQNKVYLLTVVIKKHVRNGEPQDFNWVNGVQQKMELLDAKGRKYQCQGATNFINNSPTSVHATYQFVPPQAPGEVGPPAKFVFNEWLTISHELEFEFKDLPLP